MTLLEKMNQETQIFREEMNRTAERRRQEYLNWQEQVEKNVNPRLGRTILDQILITFFTVIVTLIGDKLITWYF